MIIPVQIRGGLCVLLKEPIPLCGVDIYDGLGIDDFFDVLDRPRFVLAHAESEDITGFPGIPSSGKRHSESGYLPRRS